MHEPSVPPASRIRCLIVDDERLAREGLRALLAEDPRFVVAAESASGQDALRRLRDADVDVLFLDVQMPGVDGFQFLKSLDDQHIARPEVVMVTAFDEYAVRAFEAAALDYVLKPVGEKRFFAVLDRVAQRIAERAVVRRADDLVTAIHAARAVDAPPRTPETYLARFAVRAAGRTIFVDSKDVHLIEADGYCVKLHAAAKIHVLRATMAALQSRLDPRRFVRVHRSAIVNVEHVAELRPYDRGHYTLVLRSGQTVRMSRERREQLEAFFG